MVSDYLCEDKIAGWSSLLCEALNGFLKNMQGPDSR
jgi:hypothetical protein